MQLRAERYLEKCREPKEFVALIEKVRAGDFDTACRFYDKIVPQLEPAEQALLVANDRFFLMSEVLGRKKIKPSLRHPWMYARCREVEAKSDGSWISGRVSTARAISPVAAVFRKSSTTPTLP
jgi:hypothetical protein